MYASTSPMRAGGRWWALVGAGGRQGLRNSFRWRVKQQPNYYTIIDRQITLNWRAGRPFVANILWEVQSGRILCLSRQKIWALSDHRRIEPVLDYQFNAREGRDLIRAVARQQGLKERPPLILVLPPAIIVALTLALISALAVYTATHP
ncbi:hypothetical protein Mycsm_06933 (plasmid) [Mycobacterium sp. JS623]|uniref:hypothetical protein n=1 Tax=Mycobacterium sp. JS623 TaxID=212767 RepID=UPI0002A5B113|nr:hypothetical protein [Mycobacterium sp. JS623]AGB27035.1 hypothetical protein Mycsm_06933 [Mycobacterium sp. JS623]